MLRLLAVRIASLLLVLALLASALFTPAPAQAAPASGLTPPTGLLWDLQRPESHVAADHMGPRSLYAGPYGLLYTAFGGNHLYLFTDDGYDHVSTETVDPAWGVGQYTSLVADSDYDPRISYVDRNNNALKYAAKNNGSWTIETVDALGGVIGHTSLALYSWLLGQNPGISYYAWDNYHNKGVLKYAYNTCVPFPCRWVYQTVQYSSTFYIGENSSLGYDSSNHPAIAYSMTDHESASWLSVAGWNGSDWKVWQPDDSVVPDSIAMANSGNLFYISYIKYNSVTGHNDLKVTWSTNGAAGPWSVPAVVDNSAVDKGYTSIALGGNNDPYIAYGYDVSSTSERLKLAHFVGSGGNCPGNSAWSCEVAQSNLDDRVLPANLSLAIGPDGTTPLIAYTNLVTWDTSYRLVFKGGGGVWVDYFEPLASPDVRGYVTSLALDSGGMAHISYSGDSGGLFFTEQTGASTWSTLQVTDGMNTIFPTSLALDSPSNTPYIAYIRYGALMEAHPVASGGNCGPTNSWLCETITTAAISQSGFLSLAIYNHNPYIVYHDYNNKRLALASYVGSGGSGCLGGTAAWKCVGLDSPAAGEDDVGYYASIVIGGGGLTTIVYGTKTIAPSYKLEAIRGNIANLTQGTGITQATILSDIGNFSYGGYLSIANGNHPHASYYQSLPGSIGVGHVEYVGSGGSGCAPSATPAWKCELLVTTGDAGKVPLPRQTSIAADIYGNVAISYTGIDSVFYSTLDVLRYVSSSGNTAGGRWYWQNLAGSGEIGTDSSIQLDSRGLPRVSLFDKTNGQLRYAVSEFGVFIPVIKK